jgi:hypothetical protein
MGAWRKDRRSRARVRVHAALLLALCAYTLTLLGGAHNAFAAKVPPASTSTTLQESASSTEYGHEQSVTFTATVTASNGATPSGAGDVLNGTAKVCKLTISKGSGSCSPKPTRLKTGSYSLVAEFKKSSKFSASRSNSVDFVVGTSPETTITSAPSGKVPSGEAEITFSSNEPLASFQCSLDGGTFTTCTSPHVIDVGPGKHEFRVRAVSADGIVDPTPATATWESVGQAPELKLCGEITRNTELAPEDAATYVIECPVTVAVGATLSMAPGTIVKAEQNTYIRVEGSLVGSGTSEKPVTLTSWRDDSVGGTTDGSEGSTEPAAGDWGGIESSPAGNGNANPTLSLEHTVVNYASRAISTYRTTTSVTNSSVGHSSGEGIYVEQPEGVPTVTGNTITYAAGQAIEIYDASINVGALNGNSGSNDGLNGVALGDDTVTVSSSLPWTGTLVPVLTSGCDSLTVPVKVTLTLGAGTIIKGEDCTYIRVEGSLVGSGTSEKPVTLTSWRDDSVGGITLETGASACLIGTTIKYATTGLSVAEGDEATIHGAILESRVGVSSNTYVEATEVNWGSSSGPGPEGAGTVVEGEAVNVTPWVGYVAPSKPAPPEPPPPVTATCPSILVIGARGSGEPASSGYTEPLTDVGTRVDGVYYGFRTEIEDYDSSHKTTPQTLEIRGLQYPAASTDELLHFAFAQYFESVWDGVYGLEDMLAAEESRCPKAKIVLSGYSQGALAIHLALAEESGSKLISPTYIAAVLLVADPAKTGGNEVINVGTAKASADGIYTKIFGTSVGPLATPGNLSKRIESLCKNHDIICAPGIGATIGNHEGYDSEELEPLGAWGAEEVLAGN